MRRVQIHAKDMNSSTAMNLTNDSADSSCYGGYMAEFRTEYVQSHGYIASMICIAGILANIANIVVFTRPKMATSPVNWLLMMVAIADLCLMLVYLPMAIVFYIVLHEPTKDPLMMHTRRPAEFLYFCISFVVVCHSTAIWHTIAVASFRWLTLGMTNGKTYCTLRNARICSGVLVLINILLSIPNWYTNEPGAYHNYTDCHYTMKTFYTVRGKEDLTFNNWLFACFGKILPCTLLTILTIPLLIIMRNADIKRRLLLSKGKCEESKRHHEHNRTTGMLLAVVVIFLVIELPHGIYIIVMKYDKTNNLEDIYHNIGELLDIVTLVAFSINFILYSVMSRQFRTTFFSLFCKKTVEQQANNFRRLSTALTHIKHSSVHKRSHAFSHSATNTSILCRSEDKMNTNFLHPTASPLLGADDRTMTTSCGSDTHSGNNVSLI